MKNRIERFLVDTKDGFAIISESVINPQINYTIQPQKEAKVDTVTPEFSIEEIEE